VKVEYAYIVEGMQGLFCIQLHLQIAPSYASFDEVITVRVCKWLINGYPVDKSYHILKSFEFRPTFVNQNGLHNYLCASNNPHFSDTVYT
jgi:hypothetical protein